MKALIVDDTPGNLRLLRALLEAEDFDVAEAADGVQALEILELEPVDAIISDVLMPNMDGYHFCRAVRSRKHLRDLPFVFYTNSYDSPEDERLALSAGADKFIRRPASPKEVIDVLSELLRHGPWQHTEPTLPENDPCPVKAYNESLVQKLEKKNEELFQLAELLRTREEKLRQLAENIDEFIWIATPDRSEIFYASPAYEKIWGRTCASLYADPDSFLAGIPKSDFPRLAAAEEQMNRNGNYDLEHQVVRPDGEIRWVHSRATAICNDDGLCCRVVGTAEDITQRKRAEAELRRSMKMEALREVSRGLAGGLNRLLTTLRANLEMLEMEERNFRRRGVEHLREIGRAMDQSAALARELSAFSPNCSLRTEPVRMNALLESVGPRLRRLAGSDIEVLNDIPAELPAVQADPRQIEQMLGFLVVNARDAMPEGGRIIIDADSVLIDSDRAAGNPRARKGRFVCLALRDNGAGIPPENLHRLFEPFFSTKTEGQGLGLGLAAVFGIVEKHGGWIDVASEVGAGTTFRIFLPVAEVIAPHAAGHDIGPLKPDPESAVVQYGAVPAL